MKEILCIVPVFLATLMPCVKADFASPSEFGATELELMPIFGARDTLRHWGLRHTGDSLHATLQGIRGQWGKQATVILRTMRGRQVRVPVSALDDVSVDFLTQWLKQHEFEPIATQNHGTLYGKILAIYPGVLPEEFTLQLLAADGRVHSFPVTTRGKPHSGVLMLTPAALERVKNWQQQHPQAGVHAPLPVAADTHEALVYSELRGLTTVVLFLGKRGSGKDMAFRHYLAQHPEAAAEWSNRFVFLLVYAEENGTYSPELCHKLDEFAYAHNVQVDGFTSMAPTVLPSTYAWQDEHALPSLLCGMTFIGNPDVGQRHVVLQRIHSFRIKTEDFLRLEPSSVPFFNL